MKLHGSLNIKGNDLYMGDIKLIDVAKEFKTPLYIMDENLIRDNIKEFKEAMGDFGYVAYASKTFLNSHMISILKEMGMHLDVVSYGEMYIAYKNGFDMGKVIFHGNNKSYDEIKFGIEVGVSRFVCDSVYELKILKSLSEELNKKVNVFLRINPGIDAHTHEYIKTACIDSKFGIYKDKEVILDILREYKDSSYLNIVGLHTHIGSQIFSKEAYIDSVDSIFDLLNTLNDHGFTLNEVNFGGGFGIYYTKEDSPMKIKEYVDTILNKVRENVNKYNLKIPKIYIEPGRSIVGNAGTTLYEIGTIKEIKGVRNYVSVDGGMSDNIRTPLYGASYECMIINKCAEEKNYKGTISGKLCESGDIVIKDAFMETPEPGDILAVFSTGAYCHSMSSNYNKVLKPPVVFYYNNEVKLRTKRESLDDLMRLDV